MPSAIKPEKLDALDAFVRRFPKVDIHYHMLSGTRLATLCELAAENHVPLSPDDARQYYRGELRAGEPGAGGIAALHLLYRLLISVPQYQRVLREIAADAAAVGVRYLELFWNPSDTALPYREVTEGLITTARAVAAAGGPVIRFIPAINRDKTPLEAERMVADVVAYPSEYVVGLGIAYHEAQGPIEDFRAAYAMAAAAGLHLTGHCGEFGLPWTRVQAGLDLGLERIDHGYSVLENDALCERCVAERIPFTVIPSNTYFLRKWPDPAEWAARHPIREMARRGLTIVPGTDDWYVHGTDAAKVYRTLVVDFGFDLAALRQCMLNGIHASWAPAALKARWLVQWPAEFDRLRDELGLPAESEGAGIVRYRRA